MNTVSQQLRNAPVGLDNYVDYLNDVLDGIVELDQKDAVFNEAFSFFERHDAADLGAPGPLVQFLEQFYPAYVSHLCASVGRKPTTYTVWMLNRILNSSLEAPDRNRLLAVLDAASTNSAADPVAREQAIDFLRQQLE